MYDADGIESQLITAQTRAACCFACVSSRGHGINKNSVNAVFLNQTLPKPSATINSRLYSLPLNSPILHAVFAES